MATEDEFCDLGTEVSTDDETYELETEEETSETEEETYEYESEAEAEAKETAKDEIQYDEVRDKRGLREKINGSKPRDIRRYCCQICGLVRSKRNRLKIHIMSHHSIEVDTESKIDKFIEKKTPEDCKILESEVKESRKTEINGSKPRDIRRYCCQICGLVRAKRKRLKVHIMLHHGVEIDTAEIDKLIEKKNPEDCEILESEAKKSRKVENDGFKARGLRSYCCVLCGLIRSKRKLLKNHIILEHREEADTKDEMDKFIEKRHSENDKRRYSCQICGVLRSKRVLLKFHVISSHGLEALKRDKRFASDGTGKHLQCVCNMCGMSFSKPSHLQQHNLSHSALRSFVCPIVGCLCSYKRQDHLNRHLLKHEGELFVCPREDCKLQLSTLSNLKRHLNRHRERGKSWQSQSVKSKETNKKHICPELYCEKAFKYPSKLAKHLEDVHSTTYTEIICCEPGCLKYFTNAEALKEHLRQAHNRICCEVCGSQQLKKQIKRHMRIHENQTCVKSIACPYERCLHSYTTKSNLRQHIKSVHLELKPFKCQFRECGMTFAHKFARDRHEMSGAHCYVQGDFLEEDVAFQSRPRGGRKRKAFTIDSIFRKRVAGPDQSTVLENGLPFMDWLISDNAE